MDNVLTPREAAKHLRKAYRQGRLIPFLGAGFSIPLRLPSWSGLMDWMGKELRFQPGMFELHGRNEQLAGYFALKRDKHLTRFVRKMKEEFHRPDVERRRKKDSIQHHALARRSFQTIYTTNFERHIERALKDAGKKAQTLATLKHFQSATSEDTCQVIKFHGDLMHPETVVLTESHFFDRMRLEAPPDQRLRSDLLGNSFLFLGYSFSDVNIRYIWYRLNQLRRESAGDAEPKVAPERQCYWATFGVGHVQPRLLQEWNIKVISLDPSDKSQSVVDLLDSLDA